MGRRRKNNTAFKQLAELVSLPAANGTGKPSETDFDETANAYQDSSEKFEHIKGQLRTGNQQAEQVQEFYLERIVAIQKRLDERFDRSWSFAGFAARAKRGAEDVIAHYFGGKNDPKDYGKDDIRLVEEQRAYTSLLEESLGETQDEISGHYKTHETQRVANMKTLSAQLSRLSEIDDEERNLQLDEIAFNEETKRVTGKDKKYSQLHFLKSSLSLTKRKLKGQKATSEEVVAICDRRGPRLEVYQGGLAALVQVLQRARVHLSQLMEEQYAAHTNLMALSDGLKSMRVANEIMGNLSNSIYVTHDVVADAFGELRDLSKSTTNYALAADKAGSKSEAATQDLRESENEQTVNVHNYVQELRNKPFSERMHLFETTQSNSPQ